tara:strand:+ start:1333 stop:1941 length:609 start_codon:yes stop_codon:yes gene_type:complete
LIKNLLYFTALFGLGCSTPKGNLEKVSKEKGIGVISFKIFDERGEDISDNCIIRYTFGNGEYTQSYQLENSPHFLELDSYFNVKKLSCMINLLVYTYEFDSFDYKIKNGDAYFFGEYHFKYDYRGNYRETRFYVEAKKCQYDGDKSGYCENSEETWTNEGKLTFLKVKALPEDALEKSFPGHKKKLHHVDGVKPRNVLKANL